MLIRQMEICNYRYRHVKRALLNIQGTHLHNAANDAAATLHLLIYQEMGRSYWALFTATGDVAEIYHLIHQGLSSFHTLVPTYAISRPQTTLVYRRRQDRICDLNPRCDISDHGRRQC
jgi:hypothetical protein